MATNELTELLRALLSSPSGSSDSTDSLTRGLADLARSAAPSSAQRIVSDVQALAQAAPVWRPPAVSRSVSNSAAPSGDTSSLAGSFLKTAAMVTGVGPAVTGLLKLFGSGRNEEPPPPLIPYSAPSRVSVEAGIGSDRSFVPVAYGSSGLARSAEADPVRSAPAATQIHVNVNALDSRSFIDHSDEIARAVRDAMLRSHSLNDVVSEI